MIDPISTFLDSYYAHDEEPPMTREELEDTIGSALTSHSSRSSKKTLEWEIGVVMSAVDKYVAHIMESWGEYE